MIFLRRDSVWEKFGRLARNSTETVFFHKISPCVFWSIGQCHLWNHRPPPAIWLPSHPKHLRCIRKVILLNCYGKLISKSNDMYETNFKWGDLKVQLSQFYVIADSSDDSNGKLLEILSNFWKKIIFGNF